MLNNRWKFYNILQSTFPHFQAFLIHPPQNCNPAIDQTISFAAAIVSLSKHFPASLLCWSSITARPTLQWVVPNAKETQFQSLHGEMASIPWSWLVPYHSAEVRWHANISRLWRLRRPLEIKPILMCNIAHSIAYEPNKIGFSSVFMVLWSMSSTSGNHKLTQKQSVYLHDITHLR